MKRRICSLWLPNLAIERWANGSGTPEAALARTLVLTVEGRHGQLIHAVTPAAAERGARPGGRLADARALDPALEAEAADVAGEAAWLRAAARWASRWSPLVEVDGSDALRLDVSGIAHLFGGEQGLLGDMVARFEAMGVGARAAVAPTAGAAWALARYAPRPRPVHEEELARVLAPLPVGALRLSPIATHMLVRLGLKQVGDLAGVPRKTLARRFPRDEHPLDALDRALGRKPEPLTPLPEDPPPRALLPIKEPVVHPEALEQALRQLVPRLARELETRKLGARQLVLTAYRVDGSLGEVEVATSIPSREPGHLHRLLSGMLERQGIDPGFGIDAFALEVRWWERLDSAQEALLGPPTADTAIAALVDRLSVRLGPGKVRRPAPAESHVPERAAGWVEGVAASLPATPSRKREGDDPTRLLDSPEEIAVIYATPEGLPRRFVWRRKVHDIARAQGPRRISPEWWRERSSARLRDYYKVEDSEGRRFWIFRQGLVGDGRGGPPAWFVHGLFA
ncbi:DNA polymerase Y family protein [Sphingomonas sp. LHG3406-1]|uniref:Y-family DNA polymerase n=1 Tax=Sphingomonas sp. LHG3406-1 TaxID=2804617 RepID=UPI0026046275|nr:DNA polymerase Y family protein [Sphingomonas sp. LHG3406-1]